ncbi:MAG TPA: metallophosphoesterase family protein [Trueperaceae bacterium]
MIAVLADVHGNLAALEAVVADMLRYDVDEVLCLGDMANMGPEPSATLARLRSLQPLTVMGNTDSYLLHPRSPADVKNANEATPLFLAVEAWCASRLTDEDREWVSGFSPYLQLDVGGCNVLAYHGSPRSFDDPVQPDTPEEQLRAYFAGFEADLFLGAHVHHQFVRGYGRSIVANPGSVGMAYYRLGDGVEQPPVAEYALLQVVDGQPNLHLRRVTYDTSRVKDAAARNGMPHADVFLGNLQ